VPQKQAKEPVTLLIIPHSQRGPISVRFPTWILSILSLLLVAVLIASGTFVVRYYLLTKELAELRRLQRTDEIRQQELRETILSQHSEVKSLESDFNAQMSAIQQDYNTLYRRVTEFQHSLTEQVRQFRTELEQIERLTDEVRSLVGLDEEPTPTPAAAATDKESSLGGFGAGLARADLAGTGSNLELSVREILDAETNPTVQELQALKDSLPARLSELEHLKKRVSERISVIEPEKRKSPEELERQLRLWDAAPKGWPVSGRITSTFGYRIFRGKRDFHTGIDIAVWYRTPVAATADGVVTAAGWMSGYGWAVEIQHAEGWSTIYGHLSRYLVDVGDRVKRGQIIGLSGNSGNSTGPHVHYEIRLNGVPVDPWRYATVLER
jgi:murein DD-endopeptidase MepM/ murein hydrolase activator NlpD